MKTKNEATLTEKRFFEWHEDDVSVTLRNKSGSYGVGGSEVFVIYSIRTQLDLSNTAITKDQDGNIQKQTN